MVVKTRQKLYLLICGDFAEFSAENILQKMPELNIIADVTPVFIFTKHSSNITPADWIKIAGEIKKNYDKADGFVLLHQIDNLLFTASALTFLLQGLDKPIIITGAQDEQNASKSGMKANLINASQAVRHNVKEVSILFGNKLLRAVNATQMKDESLNIFTAPSQGVLGRIDFSIRIFEKALRQSQDNFKFFDKLNANIEVLDLSPVIDIKDITKRFDKKDGIIINARMYKKLPEDLLFVLEKINKETPVIVWNRRLKNLNSSSDNLLLINNMTWQTTVTKLMWSLTQEKDLKNLKDLMSKNITGEILE